MFITGLGTAAPEQRYTQAQCWDALQNSDRFQQLAPRSRAILRKVLTGSNGIATRHLSLDPVQSGTRSSRAARRTQRRLDRLGDDRVGRRRVGHHQYRRTL